MVKSDRQYVKIKIIVLASFGLFSIVWALLPENIIFNSAGVCYHYKIFGLECPFCGLSRAAYCLVHFQFAKAWNFNPLIYYIAWLYALEWATLANSDFIIQIRKISWWIFFGLVLWIYGIRLIN